MVISGHLRWLKSSSHTATIIECIFTKSITIYLNRKKSFKYHVRRLSDDCRNASNLNFCLTRYVVKVG